MFTDQILFQEEDNELPPINQQAPPWKILVVDDDPSVHDVTRLALAGFEFDNRPVELVYASSSDEARENLTKHPDIALALVDVVMESDHAGLELVDWIRNELKNRFIRLVLRTGQPGHAPEQQVILKYDINDYKEKTELTVNKLHTLLITSLRNYKNLMALEKSRMGLERMVIASREFPMHGTLDNFISGILLQLQAILSGRQAVFARSFGLVNQNHQNKASDQIVIAGTGNYSNYASQRLSDIANPKLIELVDSVLQEKQSQYFDTSCVIYFENSYGNSGILYMDGCDQNIDHLDKHLLDLFCTNTSYAFDNLHLNQEIEKTQQEIAFTLGTIAEFRSKETGDHIARVSLTAQKLAQLHEMGDQEAQLILTAMPMHDIGKIAVPDDILHHRFSLDDEQWKVMKTHAQIGYDMLKGSNRELFKAAAVIAHQHHENWDGTGYPNGIEGKDIHLYARIASVADVFDALGHKRSYKDAWPLSQIIDYFKEMRGQKFDPEITDLLLDNMDVFTDIARTHPDRV